MQNNPHALTDTDGLSNRPESPTSVLAHQLRNSLNGMMMRVELLGREIGAGGSKHLERLRQDIIRLDQAIETMLQKDRPTEK